MAWQMPRRNQNGIETQVKFCMLGMRHQPPLRGVDDARLLARRHRIGGVIETGAGLDLDDLLRSSLARDSVKDSVAHAVELSGRPRREVYARALELAKELRGNDAED